jgi:hypothetical protein
MKKIILILSIMITLGLMNCKSLGKDRVSIHPTLKSDAHQIITRPTESTVEIDVNTWIEGESYKGKELFGIAFFENRFVSPTLLNKEGYDAYTLDAIYDAVEKGKSDAFHIVKAKAEVFAFPLKQFAIYATYQVKVKGHPVKHKFLGPISEQKADEMYAAGMAKDVLAIDLAVPLFPAKEIKAAPCCVR